jgi:hypothetical protein
MHQLRSKPNVYTAWRSETAVAKMATSCTLQCRNSDMATTEELLSMLTHDSRGVRAHACIALWGYVCIFHLTVSESLRHESSPLILFYLYIVWSKSASCWGAANVQASSAICRPSHRPDCLLRELSARVAHDQCPAPKDCANPVT